MRKYRPSLGWTLFLLFCLANVIDTPYVLLSPGPTYDTLGKYSGRAIVEISGTKTYPTAGELDMTTVTESGGPDEGVSVVEAVWGLLDNETTVLPRDLVYEPDSTLEEDILEGQVDFNSSQSDATAAALRYLEKPINTDVAVLGIGLLAPAYDRLQPGDRIISVNGDLIEKPSEVVAAIRKQPIGFVHKILVHRGNRDVKVKVKSVKHYDDIPETNKDESQTPYIGITVGYLYSAEFPITFHLDRVGGPSAGTMFALAIVDKLTPGWLTGGKIIAGTGTISPSGKVGPIGGIEHKMQGAKRNGAELFIAPESNCDEILGHVPKGLTVASVSTLAEAVDALKAHTAGKPVPLCQQ